MAKVNGPLFSTSASGAFGGALVFATRKGLNVVRKLVIPANPKSAGQAVVRGKFSVTAAIQHQINLNPKKQGAMIKSDKLLLIDKTPSGQTWNSFLVGTILGPGGATYTATRATYAAISAPQKAAWDTAAAGMTPPIVAVIQKGAKDVAAPSIPAGEVLYIMQTALYASGAVPTAPVAATPPVYA
jgi:hypothetical protein